MPGIETKCSEGKFHREQPHFAHAGEETSAIQGQLFKDWGRVSKNWFNVMTDRPGTRTQDTIAK